VAVRGKIVMSVHMSERVGRFTCVRDSCEGAAKMAWWRCTTAHVMATQGQRIVEEYCVGGKATGAAAHSRVDRV
jgi:hypothetical protein